MCPPLAAAQPATVMFQQKIGEAQGGFQGQLADHDDGGAERGAIWVLFLNSDGTVGAEQKISSTTGGVTGPLTNGDQFGFALAPLGDLDGDGTQVIE